MPNAEIGKVIRSFPADRVRESQIEDKELRLEIDEDSQKNIEKIEANSRVAIQASGGLIVR